jgi:hypothetical protein
MIALLYCPELNIFRIRNIISGKQAVKSETELINAGIAQYIIDGAKSKPNEENIIGY